MKIKENLINQIKTMKIKGPSLIRGGPVIRGGPWVIRGGPLIRGFGALTDRGAPPFIKGFAVNI